MTVTNNTNKYYQSGSGLTGPYSFPFKIFLTTDIQVYKNAILLTLGTDYTVTISNVTDGGTVTFTVAPLSTDKLIFIRTLPLTQVLNIPAEGPLPTQQMDNAYDRGIMVSQQLQEEINRSLTIPVTTAANISTAIPVPQANSTIKWDPTGTFFINSTYDPDAQQANAASYASAAYAYQNAAAASAVLAQQWASLTGVLIASTDYSAKEYAIGTTVPAGSAKYWASAAQAFSASASGSATAAAGSATSAANSAASLNLPTLSTANPGQVLQVNTAKTAYQYADIMPFSKNKIIGGSFTTNVWARGSSFTATGYTADRWYFQLGSGNTTTVSQKLAPLGPSYRLANETQPKYVMNVTKTAGSASDLIRQSIESVLSLAGQTVTLSFSAALVSGSGAMSFALAQVFGTGGTPSATVNATTQSVTITSTPTRYSLTWTLPEITGKTLGTNADDCLQLITNWPTALFNIDFWDIQLEVGSFATVFERRPAAIERVLCQRYYATYNGGSGNNGSNQSYSFCEISYLTIPRINPTVSVLAALAVYNASPPGLQAQHILGSFWAIPISTSTGGWYFFQIAVNAEY